LGYFGFYLGGTRTCTIPEHTFQFVSYMQHFDRKLDECMLVTQITYSEKKYNAELRICDRKFTWHNNMLHMIR